MSPSIIETSTTQDPQDPQDLRPHIQSREEEEKALEQLLKDHTESIA
jgi:hypothetical protein